MRLIVLPILTLCVVCVSCSTQVDEPRDVPFPKPVGVEVIPQPFDQGFYFLHGWDEGAGVEEILETLLAEGFQVQRAWVPDRDRPGPCMVFAQLTQLVVELQAPDGTMLDHGFTQDTGNVHLGHCNPFWLEYDYR